MITTQIYGLKRSLKKGIFPLNSFLVASGIFVFFCIKPFLTGNYNPKKMTFVSLSKPKNLKI